MTIKDINDQVERYAELMKTIQKAQYYHVTNVGANSTKLFKHLYGLLNNLNHSVQEYRFLVNEDINRRRKNLAQEQYSMENRMFNERFNNVNRLTEQYKKLKEQLHKERQSFQKVVNDINAQNGRITHVWGDFVEKAALEAASNILAKDFEVLSFASKVKKIMVNDVAPKRHQLEVDMIAEGSDKIFVVETKSTLRETSLKQVINVLARMDDFFPQYKGMKKQPIFACLSSEEGMLEMALNAGIWLLLPIDSEDEASDKIEFGLVKDISELTI